MKDKRVAFGLYVVLFMVFWNLLDFIFIVKGSYHFSGGIDLGLPLAIALISGYFFFLKDKSN